MKNLFLITVLSLTMLILSHFTAAAQPFIPRPTANTLPVLRYYNAKLKRHYLSVNPDEFGAGKFDWVFEKTVGWINRSGGPASIKSYYNPSTSAHYYTVRSNIPSGFSEGGNVIGTPPHTPQISGIPVTEYKTPDGKDYIYVTTTVGETLTGWINDGIVFYVFDHSF